MSSLLFALFISFFRIGLFGFGGGYAILTLVEYEIIQLHGWITTPEFLNIVAVAEMTPGPIAINAATFVGYSVSGLAGAAIATFGLILPQTLLALPVAWLFSRYRENKMVGQILKGIHPATIAIIALAAFVFGQSALVDLTSCLIFGAALALLFLTKINPLLLIALGAITGLLLY